MLNRTVIRKLALAKKMERDALAEMIPERERAHLAVIGREVRAMVKENFEMNPAELAEVLATFMEVREIFCEESPTQESPTREAGEPQDNGSSGTTGRGKRGPDAAEGSAHTRKVDIA